MVQKLTPCLHPGRDGGDRLDECTVPRFSRRDVLAALAAVSVARPGFAEEWPELVAARGQVQLAPTDYGPTEVWAFDGAVPGPVLRGMQGGRMRQRVVNRLEVPTTVHWHGIRLENNMDGVPELTQNPIAPGDTFDYDFRLPDAGTYWYHSHNRSFEQVARGLLGPLIVDETDPPEVDLDEVLMLDDWRLQQDASLAGSFGALFDMAHGGRIGNWITVNGVGEWQRELPHGARVRLRLINGANARVFSLSLKGLRAFTVALDGQPVTTPFATDSVSLAPAQRVDLVADVTAKDGGEALILSRERDGDFAVASFPVVAGQAPRSTRVEALTPNPVPVMDGLPDVPLRALRMEGGAMGGMAEAMSGGEMRDARTLAQEAGLVWAMGGVAGMPDAPFFEVTSGTPVRIGLINDTAWPHAMHLHGHHFYEVVDGQLGALRDTTLVAPRERAEIALIADNPGDWLLHCHMLEHAASGMMSWFRVT